MYGNTLTRVANVLGQMALHPKDAARWWASAVRRRGPVDAGLPWTSYGAIDYLRRTVREGMKVFEWGGGGSTRFFVRRGCRVTTAESNEQWANAIERAVAGEAGEAGRGSLEVRRFAAETADPRAVSDYVRAVHHGGPWDVVLIDGLEEAYVSRMDCAREVGGAVRPGGMVILDDAWRHEYDAIPQVLAGWRRLSFRGLGFARLGVTQTDIYLAPA